MRIALLTSVEDGLPSIFISRVAAEPGVDVVAVIQSEGKIRNRAKFMKRKVKKIRRIGVLGALNARRIQAQFSSDLREQLSTVSVEEAASKASLPFFRTRYTNSDETRRILREAKADLGISLGNSWIAESVFKIPRMGMINVHHEVLPNFRGAQSVIWQLYSGSAGTGYTIHQVDRDIDTGRILYSEAMGIDLQPSFRKTVCSTTAKVQRASIEGLLHTIRNFEELASASSAQGPGTTFTTPTIGQYLQMRREHRRLYRLSRNSGSPE